MLSVFHGIHIFKQEEKLDNQNLYFLVSHSATIKNTIKKANASMKNHIGTPLKANIDTPDQFLRTLKKWP